MDQSILIKIYREEYAPYRRKDQNSSGYDKLIALQEEILAALPEEKRPLMDSVQDEINTLMMNEGESAFSTTSSYDIQFNLYGHYGTSMQLFTESSFIVADGVMALAGLCMVAATLKDGLGESREAAPFLVTVAAALFLNNLALGFAAGIAAHALTSIFDRQRSLTIGNICAAVVSIGCIVLTVLL